MTYYRVTKFNPFGSLGFGKLAIDVVLDGGSIDALRSCCLLEQGLVCCESSSCQGSLSVPVR